MKKVYAIPTHVAPGAPFTMGKRYEVIREDPAYHNETVFWVKNDNDVAVSAYWHQNWEREEVDEDNKAPNLSYAYGYEVYADGYKVGKDDLLTNIDALLTARAEAARWCAGQAMSESTAEEMEDLASYLERTRNILRDHFRSQE